MVETDQANVSLALNEREYTSIETPENEKAAKSKQERLFRIDTLYEAPELPGMPSKPQAILAAFPNYTPTRSSPTKKPLGRVEDIPERALYFWHSCKLSNLY